MKIKLLYSAPKLHCLAKANVGAVCLETGSSATNTGTDNGFSVCNNGDDVSDYAPKIYCAEENQPIEPGDSTSAPCSHGSGDSSDWVRCVDGSDKAV